MTIWKNLKGCILNMRNRLFNLEIDLEAFGQAIGVRPKQLVLPHPDGK